MAQAVTRSAMRTRVRSLANMETAAASAFVTDTEINQWLDDAIRETYDKLIQARGEDYYATSSTQTLTVGSSDYYICPAVLGVLPAQLFYRMLEVVVSDTGEAVRVPRFQAGQYAQQVNEGLSGNARDKNALRWRLIASDKVQLLPAPGAAWTLTCHYIPAFVTLSGDSSTFDGINGWEGYACLLAARRCLMKEESDTTTIDGEIARTAARIDQMACRDDSEPRTIGDTRGDLVTVYPAARLSRYY
jgi:hypothetical protein